MSETALVVQERPAIIAAPRYSDEQMQLLTDTIARGCDPNEFKLFIEIAKMSRLNPFTGQIRPVKRWNSDLNREAMVVQTGIDGYRAIASRTGELAGIEDARFDAEEEEHPNWAKVTVYRWSHGEKVAFSTTARWKEYVQTKKGGAVNAMWTRMPYLMLAKCAEALALRKAFPDELTGVYTDEEMGQADNPQEGGGRPPVTQPRRASEKQPEQKNGNAAAPVHEKVGGVIETVREGKDGALWIMLKEGIVLHLAEKFVEDTVKEGATISANTVKVQRDGNNTYYGVVEVLSIGSGGGGGAPAASAEDQGKLVQELDSAMSQEQPAAQQEENTSQGTVNLGELMEKGDVKKASDLPPGGGGKKIGNGRAQRLYAMCGQNKEANNGLNEKNLKRILANLTPPLEHLGDLPTEFYPQFEKLATGEVDWRPLLEE